MSADPHTYRRLTPHSDLTEDAYHEAVHWGDWERRDAIGRLPAGRLLGWHRWQVIICDNPDCGYRALVRADVVERIANAAESITEGLSS